MEPTPGRVSTVALALIAAGTASAWNDRVNARAVVGAGLLMVSIMTAVFAIAWFIRQRKIE